MEAAVRLGLALYRKTVREGADFYSIYDLVFADEVKERPASLFLTGFAAKSDFWGVQQEAARMLDGAGLVQVHRKQMPNSAVADYSLRLTKLGKAIYSLAYLQSDTVLESIEGITSADVAAVLADDGEAQLVASEFRDLDDALNGLALSNFQRASVNSYVNMLVSICEMPERDAKLFWVILERLSHFADVASLIVAVIALRLAR